jgi:hypothetical protein
MPQEPTFGFRADGNARRIRDGCGTERDIRVGADVTASLMGTGAPEAMEAVVEEAGDNPPEYNSHKIKTHPPMRRVRFLGF